MRAIEQLPKLKTLKDVPNCGDEASVRKLMASTATKEERDAECFEWAATLGAWCWYAFHEGSKEAMDTIGKALEGTPARAAWDLDGRKAGVKRAIIILAADSMECRMHWVKAAAAEGIENVKI